MKTRIPEIVTKALPEFPVDHLSFSSVMKWHDDPVGFARGYVHKQWDFDTSPASVVGSAVHWGIDRMVNAVKRGELASVDVPEALTLLQTEAVMKFDRAVKGEFLPGEDETRVTKIDWGKTGSPEKSRGDILTCSRNAIEAVRAYLADWDIIATEVRFGNFDQSAIGVPLPVTTVSDAVAVKKDKTQARVVDWKTVGAISPSEDLADLDTWDANGKRRAQAGANYPAARKALDLAGFQAVPLVGADFVEIHRGKGGASGVTSCVFFVPFEAGEKSAAVEIWAEMARRAILGIFGAWFMPELVAMPINLSSEYGGADAFKALKDELANPDECLLTQNPAV